MTKRAGEEIRARRLSIVAALTLGVLFIFNGNETPALENESRVDLQTQLQRLHAATDITLMVIPRGITFRFRVDETRLPEVACVYRIQPGLGPSFQNVLNILDHGIREVRRDVKAISEARIGIIFREGDEVLQQFYFEDWGGAHDIKGVLGGYRILGSDEIPNQLRTLLTNQDVRLIKNGAAACPHS
jgi:hypothetical protein